MSKLKLILSIVLLSIILSSCTDSTSGGETLNEKVALFMPDGITPAVDATIQFFSIGDTSLVPIYQTQTDVDGRYSFVKAYLSGYYNIIATYADSLYAMQDTVYINREDYHVRDDTLNNPGSISGIVALQPNHSHLFDNVYVKAIGMGRAVNVDSSGWFTISKLAPGDYNLQVDTDLENYGPKFVDITIASNVSDTISDTIKLPYSDIPVVTGLPISYDTLNGVAFISWNKSSYGDISNYIIFRKSSDSLFFPDTPLDWVPSSDTCFFDTIFTKATNDSLPQEYDYSIVILNSGAVSGAKFGYKSVLAVSPLMVETEKTLKILHKYNKAPIDSLEKNDTAIIVATYSNPTRPYTKISWALEHPDSIIAFTNFDSLKTSRSDTLSMFWDYEGLSKVYVIIEDLAGTKWVDSAFIYIWKYPVPVHLEIDSISYTTAYLRWSKNQDLDFKSYNINYGVLADFITQNIPDIIIKNSNDTTLAISGLLPDSVYNFRIDVLDSAGFLSEGNSIKDTTKAPPIISKVVDTIVSQSMDCLINVSAFDKNTNSNIEKIYWDIGNNGWDDSTTVPFKNFTLPEGGKIEVVWGAVNIDGHITADTFSIFFNRKPTSCLVSVPPLNESWEDLNFISMTGGYNLILNGIDPDGEYDTLTYTLWLSSDSITWKEKYSGLDTLFQAPLLNANVKYYWKLRTKDLYKDSLISSGSFTTTPLTTEKRMRFIPAKDSSFQMGKNPNSHSEDEGPVHKVKFTYNFWMDTTEVTQGDYHLTISDPLNGYPGYVSHGWNSALIFPANYVTWYDAILYCNARSKSEGKDTVYSYSYIEGIPGNGCTFIGNLATNMNKTGYRLPTEAEWEYSCRAGTTTDYYWGDFFDNTWMASNNADDYAWYNGNYDATLIVNYVASKTPNNFGLYDMSGNVWEWTNDWFSYYSSSDKIDQIGPSQGTFKVMRGGASGSQSVDLRSANRSKPGPMHRHVSIGFRCVIHAQ